MRRLWMGAVVLCLLCSSLSAQGKFPLKYQEAGPGNDALTQMASRGMGMQPQKPPQITGLPDGMPEGTGYCRMALGAKQIWLAAAGGDSPKLYIDTDGDNDLSDEKAIAGRVEGNRIKYDATEIPVSERSVAKVRGEAYLPNNGPVQVFFLRAAGFLVGRVTLGGKTYAVALIDANFNGRYNDAFQGEFNPRDVDGLAIDLDQDGQFASPTLDSKAWEWTPVCKMVQVGEVYYTVGVAADGTAIEFEETKPKFGTLDLGTTGVELIAVSDAGAQHIKADDGKARLPAGQYAPISLTLTRKDEAGVAWTLRQSNPGEKLQRFEIRPDESLAAKVGAPLVTKTDVRQRDRNVSISYALVGQGGEQYSPGAMKDKNMLPPPTIKVVDGDGKTIHTGRLEYG